MNTYLALLILTSTLSYNAATSLDLVSVTYRITKFQDSVSLDFNLIGAGQANARVRVCDNSFGCREDMPSTIHQSQNITFNQTGLNKVNILNFTKNNESKRINVLYTNNLGASRNLNFTITSAFPKSYSIVSTTLSKVIRETSHIDVSATNVVSTVSNSLDFRSFYNKPNQNMIINFKDYLVSNGGVYINLGGFVQLLTGLENSELTKISSYYHLDFISRPYEDKIHLILDNFFVNTINKEMTKVETLDTIKTENIILSNNYNKASTNNLIFNFRNVGAHGSNIRVTTPFNVERNIFGNCNNAIVCINKHPIRSINYSRSILIK
jgi:hypothetical protein